MQLEKFVNKSCCGKTTTTYKLDRIVDINLLNSLVSIGFNELKHFTTAGLLYLDNKEFIITGPLGSNRLQINCKKSNCDLLYIENILKNM